MSWISGDDSAEDRMRRASGCIVLTVIAAIAAVIGIIVLIVKAI